MTENRVSVLQFLEITEPFGKKFNIVDVHSTLAKNIPVEIPVTCFPLVVHLLTSCVKDFLFRHYKTIVAMPINRSGFSHW